MRTRYDVGTTRKAVGDTDLDSGTQARPLAALRSTPGIEHVHSGLKPVESSLYFRGSV